MWGAQLIFKLVLSTPGFVDSLGELDELPTVMYSVSDFI